MSVSEGLTILVLKRRRRDERFVFPQDRLEYHPTDVLALEPVDYPIRDRALFVDIARRGDENLQRLQALALDSFCLF